MRSRMPRRRASTPRASKGVLVILNRVACRLSFQATTSRRALPRFYEADQRQFDRGRSGNSEIAANLLISIRRKCRCFSEICERLLEIPPDFDSAIPGVVSRSYHAPVAQGCTRARGSTCFPAARQEVAHASQLGKVREVLIGMNDVDIRQHHQSGDRREIAAEVEAVLRVYPSFGCPSALRNKRDIKNKAADRQPCFQKPCVDRSRFVATSAFVFQRC